MDTSPEAEALAVGAAEGALDGVPPGHRDGVAPPGEEAEAVGSAAPVVLPVAVLAAVPLLPPGAEGDALGVSAAEAEGALDGVPPPPEGEE